MKANWKFAIMAVAALAMIACNKKQEPKPTPDPEPEPEPEVFVSRIDVTDGTDADWAKVPANYLAEAKHQGSTQWDKLKSIKVYADKMYINILAEYDGEFYAEAQDEWSSLHVYLDADNSDATGGYGDEFADANAEWLLEAGFLAKNEPNNYDPALFKWWGEVGGDGWEWTDPSVEHSDTDFWGAVIGEGQGGIGKSQRVGTNKVEIQLLREAIEAGGVKFADTFGIGIDIQANWTSCGVLPNAADADDGSAVKAKKLKVTIDPTESN